MNIRVKIKSLFLSKDLTIGSFNCSYSIKFCALSDNVKLILKSNAIGIFLFIRIQTDARAKNYETIKVMLHNLDKLATI